MDYDHVEKELRAGRTIHRRFCAVCENPIAYGMLRGHPILVSCGCRSKKSSNVIKITWNDLRQLINDKYQESPPQ